MTVAQIEKLGFPHMGSKMKPRKFYSSIIGEFTIPEYWGIDDIHRYIFEQGIEEGIGKGELKKTNEFRRSLGMELLDTID